MAADRPPHPTVPTGPFTRSQALEAGITARQLRGRGFRHLFFDVYIAADVIVTPRIRAIAALIRFDGFGHISHSTAATLWKAWVPHDPDVHVSVFTRAHRRSGRGIKPHLAHATAQVVRHLGLRMSSPPQTFLDMARYLDLVDMVVLGDSLIHRGLVDPEDLIAAAARWRGHGARLARRAAVFVRAGVESPMEARLRMLLVLAGLPEPIVNRTITDEDGRRTYRLDLSWPDLKIAAEYDGRQHAKDSAQWRRDLVRREALDRLAWILIVVTAEDLYNDPLGVVDRVATAMRRRGARTAIALDDEWRRLFPGRQQAA